MSGAKAVELLGDESPSATPPVMVFVVAPANLHAGHTFDAEVQGFESLSFPVVVPDGGVTEGQEFLVPLPDSFTADRIVAPTGTWKDPFFHCLTYGICHPSICCGFWCTQIGMAQVMTRMNLTFLGEPGRRDNTRDTFKIVCALFLSYTIYSIALEIAAPTPDDEYDYTNPIVSLLKALGTVTFTFYAIYALMRTRESVRTKHSIPVGKCGAWEDLCLSTWCSCCTVAQMLRHTGEYEVYKGVCLSERGLPQDSPLNV